MTKRLAEDHVTMFGNTFLELLLQATTTVLVFAQARDLVDEVLEARAREAANYNSKLESGQNQRA